MQVSQQINKFIAALSITLGLASMSVQASEKMSVEQGIQDVEQRQNAFSEIDEQQEQIEDLLDDNNNNWQQLITLSTALNANSSSLQHLFVAGSQPGSKAKDKVWNDNDKFKAALTKMDNSFIKMDRAIKQQDKYAAKDALKEANKTCRNCHRQYRSRW
ncbi:MULTISPECIES: cytochrome c [unclassified Moritella]|uniref:c-type cytochrome n=1 Tax=unclassified Moritella TaxID=2637987 RepID=UPI001BAC6E5B|nr:MULTISPECIES: cytochrome c [unclassified Moritella]QUM80069.1 cytochrome c [Moritella sp. 5]QUM84321.1 cytochrome c [Moritella sp. 28]